MKPAQIVITRSDSTPNAVINFSMISQSVFWINSSELFQEILVVSVGVIPPTLILKPGFDISLDDESDGSGGPAFSSMALTQKGNKKSKYTETNNMSIFFAVIGASQKIKFSSKILIKNYKKPKNYYHCV